MSAIAHNWPIKRLRFLTVKDSSTLSQIISDGSEEVTFLPMEAIGEQGELDLSLTRPLEEVRSGYSRFKDGDVVIAKITPCFENGKGALIQNTATGIGFGTTELHVLSPGPELDGRFLYYVTVDPRFRRLGEACMIGAAGQQRVPEDFVRDYRIPLPPLPVQRAIAGYLDREVARIDALIAAKERLLGLLAEKRRALITRAVTRGLDPAAPLRDSGVPWLGAIPAHWGVVQLKFVSISLQTGPFGSQLHSEEYVNGGIPVINPSHIRAGRVYADERVTVDEATARRLAIHKLQFGDLVFARRGEIGRCGVVEANNVGWLCGTGSLRVRLRLNAANPYYVAFVFNETQASSVLTVHSVGSTMENLNTDILGSAQIPLPPLVEQHAIVAHINRETEKIDRLRVATERTIALLKERRAALIAAAVTGQIEPKGSAD